MKFDLIYDHIIKAYLSDKGLTRRYEMMKCAWNEDKYDVQITVDGVVAFNIPIDLFPFDYSRMGVKSEGLQKVVANVMENKYLASYKYTVPGIGREKLAKIESATGEYAWVNEKFLKMFEPDAQFKLAEKNSSTSPIAVFEYSKFVGAICPVRRVPDK